MLNRYSTRLTNAKQAFLASLASDLRRVGAQASVRRRRARLVISIDDEALTSPTFAKSSGNALRMRELEASAALISSVEASASFSLFVSGTDVDPGKVRLTLLPCASRAEHRLHNYCRLLQGVPNRQRPGRRIRLLILDEGQSRPALVGAIELASPLYSMGARDRYFGWLGPDGGRKKEAGLRQIMDLSLCIAVPPYSLILGGKLVATLAATDPVRALFSTRYHSRLVAIVTTCASGLHCPIFNRIMTRPGGLYRRIGETGGYGTIIFSRQTTTAATALRGRRGAGEYQKTIPLLRYAFAACGISNADRLLRTGIAKGIYLAEFSSDVRRYLESGSLHTPALDGLPLSTALELWHRLLQTRPENLNAMRKYEVSDLPLSFLLSGEKRR